MKYIQEVFSEKEELITFERIEKYFEDEKYENDIIEFKSIHQNKILNSEYPEVLKSICGFLNSEGGIIVWGAPIGQNVDSKKEKIFRGSLTTSSVRIEKDSFINKVSDLIVPFPSKIKLYEFSRDSEYMYIIEIPKSDYSPHQFKNIYYMRLDGQTRPAPHYFIDALFKRISYPKINGYLSIYDYRNQNGVHQFTIQFLIFNLSKNQNEHEIFLRLNLFGNASFKNAKTIYQKEGYSINGSQFILPEKQDTLYYNQPLSHVETIQIAPNDVGDETSQFELTALFGGKESPLKISEYRIQIPKEYAPSANFNDLIIESKENVLFHESVNNKLGEIEKIESIINRKL